MVRLTPIVRNLLIINIVVFLLQYFLRIDMSENCEELRYSPGLTGLISLWNTTSCAFHPYQFFTYMFAHGGLMHILFNMMALVSFGPALESYWGDKKFLLFYIVVGIGAGLVYTGWNNLMHPEAFGSMLGASGAIYGILAAFGIIFPNMEIMMLFIPIPFKAKYLVFIVGLMTFWMDRSGGVAHMAHFGGAIVAFILVRLIWNEGGSRY